mgnify:CR=1 FL=1
MIYLSFENAKEFVRKLNLKSVDNWVEYTKSENFPKNIPKRPEEYYKNLGWSGYSDWLGNNRASYLLEGRGRLEFEDAREFVRNLKLTGLKDWWKYCKSGKKPASIPSSPHTAYAKKWKGYGDWVGTNRTRYIDFLSLKKQNNNNFDLKLV